MNLSDKFELRDGRLYHRGGRNAGKEACPKPFKNGYKYCYVAGKQLLQHRVIYAMRHNLSLDELPEEIDHNDLDTLNNEPDNLRAADGMLNQYNIGAKSHNKSGLKGAWWAKRERKWLSQINAGGVRYTLGYFNTPEEAHAAYMAKGRELHGEFFRADKC